MKNKLFFDFALDHAKHTIIVNREFDAPLALVWKAWTNAELLDQWWAPEGYKSTTKSLRFEEGGMRHYLMEGPENFSMWGITSYAKILLHSWFSGNEYSANEEGKISEDLPLSDYQITFFDQGERTKIEHHTIYKSADDMKQGLEFGFKEGMLGAFTRLDELFRKG